jgi:hypothetical protein
MTAVASGFAGNMAPKFRRVLAEKLAQHAPMFGLSEVAFPSFELQNGWNRVRPHLVCL